MGLNSLLPKENKSKCKIHTFMDFCAGIGGGRLGLTNNNLQCVAYSEIDNYATQTYELFYGKEESNYGDLMNINPLNLPNFDLLIGGFPCQTFSIVGKRTGFEDSRGKIIYGLAKILQEKQVPCFILENVKGLINHDSGKTLKTITSLLENIGYDVQFKLLDSSDFGVPQMRERVYIVGIRKNIPHEHFEFPKPTPMTSLSKVLTDSKEILPLENPTFQKYLNNKYNKGRENILKILERDYTIIDTRQSDLRVYEDKCPTLRTGRHGILYTKDFHLYKLTGFEALLLQGFPIELAIKAKNSNIPNSKILSLAGNAMTVNVIRELCQKLIECIE